MTTNWTGLFNSYGYEVTEVNEEHYDLSKLTERNREFLISILEKLSVEMSVVDQMLYMPRATIREEVWVNHLEQFIDGRTESSFGPTEIPLEKVDVYIAGVVMQLNRIGCIMTYSCDGHDIRKPVLYFATAAYARLAKSLLEYCGLEVRRRGTELRIVTDRKSLPAIAVQLSTFSDEVIKMIRIEKNELVSVEAFNETLEQVLAIPGESGNEGRIRVFVIEELKPFVDHIEVDHYGNLIALKRFGPGPTIMLNAHLDTYETIVSGREILKKGAIWSSSEGILGADDRAGVNVVLAAAKSVGNSGFKGTMKYVFTVEEEIGLRGAQQVAKPFLWDIDMAFVIDRRGTHDIVTSRGGINPFCSQAFGTAIERIAQRSGDRHWKTIEGGSSDTFIWAQSGIESVNLSAGYWNEHTDEERLDVDACYGTYSFVMEILENYRDLVRVNRQPVRVERESIGDRLIG